MKKIMSIMICFCLLFSFSGCTKTIQFDNENDMLSYLQGVWTYGNTYYIISEDKIVATSDHSISSIMEDYFTHVIMDGTGDFSRLKAEETLMHVQDEINQVRGYHRKEFLIQPQKGMIVFDGEKIFYIVNEGLKYTDQEGRAIIYKKIADEPVVSKDVFGDLFNKTKENYELPLDKAILSPKKVAEKIKAIHSEIEGLTFVSNTNGSYVYTDSGNVNSFRTVFISSKNSVAFSNNRGALKDSPVTVSGDNKFSFQYSVSDESEIVVVWDSMCSKQLVDVLEEALLFVSKYPKALTAQQLLDKFETEFSIESGYRIYKERIDGINYTVQVKVATGSRSILIDVGEPVPWW